MRDNMCFAGLDIGSTTAKAVILDQGGDIVFSRYLRHQGRIIATTRSILEDALGELGDVEIDLAVTGSAGMGAAETFELPFVQEVVAAAHFVEKFFPEVRTLIEIGGEDSKIIFFDDNGRPDIRMNGSCAGGTGAFIDQMAVLLNVELSEMDTLARRSKNIYPIASRCGVFAKTDVQALLSRHVSKEDVAASVFHSVALQVITALPRGRDIERKIIMGGGPLTFYPALRKAFINLLGVESPDEVIVPEHSELLPAMGAAMVRNGRPCRCRISHFLSMSGNGAGRIDKGTTKRLPPLFTEKSEFEDWEKRHARHQVPRIELSEIRERDLFLGVDSGSTTTKLVLMDGKGRLVLHYYCPNNGNPIEAVKTGLGAFKEKFSSVGLCPRITRAAVTGYGESLIKAAFGLHDGVVETIAHFRAARYFEPKVSFILDIGGQDMKAIFVQDEVISEILVNEACSSGCGSFIETFARSLGYTVQEFARIACTSNAPFDLGTRCTVFMNSKVKQALREGASVDDISAGLAYSVVKNALYKVMKLKDTEILGNKIMVQGGTFRNPAVLRALEVLLGREAVRPDISELMGAYGAALTALANYKTSPEESADCQQNIHHNSLAPAGSHDSTALSLEILEQGSTFSQQEVHCKGCENRCTVLKLTFANGNHFYTGNRCERYFSNNPDVQYRGRNLIKDQLSLLFDQDTEPEGDPILTYGIPRCLNMYENFPFWCTFLTTCGFRVVLSSASNFRLYEKGFPTVMSENICFPAKLAHGHVFDLVERKVDRIFYPTVVYEQKEYEDAMNSFNCPVVTGYPDLLKSAIDPRKRFGIPLDSPAVSFKDVRLLKDQLYLFFRRFKVRYQTILKAIKRGMEAQSAYKEQLRAMARLQLGKADAEARPAIVLAGRPYHIDPLINHGVPDLLADLGVDVISEAAVPLDEGEISLADINVLTQWSYSNRLYAAAKWVAKTDGAQLVQLTSFGCGPDAVSTDEVKDILRQSGKIYTLIKMDEIANLGAVRIRLRSMLDAIRESNGQPVSTATCTAKISRTPVDKAKIRTFITPYFSDFYSPLIPSGFRALGYRVDVLPPQDKASVEWGLKTINNDMCYPAVLVAGDIIKAFESGRYDPERTGVILTQTGGQCRASAYVSLVRKGLAASGLDKVPLIAISNEEISSDAGFEIDTKGLIKRMGLGIIFADPLARMYLATMAREKIPGTSKTLHSRYLEAMKRGIANANYHDLLNLLKQAVVDFNAVEVHNRIVPRIGIVGEIFVKYNFFSNGNIIEWLSGQGVEPVLPPIQNFFAQRFINETYDQKAFFKRSLVDRIKYRLLEIYLNYHLDQIERIMQGFRFYRKTPDLRDLAAITEEVVSLANQFGEGWLLTAEMIAMLREGTNCIVCLQPFGCISNHITGRGMENRLREMFPHLNLLSLDMDAGASEVNIMNRLHFMITAAQEDMAREAKMHPGPKSARRFNISNVWSRELIAFNTYTSLEIEKWRAWVFNLGLWEKARSVGRRIGL